MKAVRRQRIKRVLWYFLGMVLLYAPFALFQRGFLWLSGYSDRLDYHGVCLRMDIGFLFFGGFLSGISMSLVFLLLVTIVSVFFGPLFCGRLCPAGALPEYLSYLVPERYKFDLFRMVSPTPLRYGFFAAYFLTPILVGSSICCAYCNFSSLEMLLTGGFWGSFGVLSSTAILTYLFWIFFLGIFIKGGRGYCNLACPVGAYQNLIYSFAVRFSFSYKLKHHEERCNRCGLCAHACPMRSITIQEQNLHHTVHSCILCFDCTGICPEQAITYEQGNAGSLLPGQEKHFIWGRKGRKNDQTT